jgi:2,4-dienoyl-CoA reductase-like NADH-dependent reductase (Old Yellow Enzyme family)
VSTRDALAPGFPEHGPRTLAGWAKELSGLPVIAVGKVSVTLTMERAYGDERDAVVDPGPALDLLSRGEADLLAVGRALIANPDWVPVVRDGDWRELRPFSKELLATLE